MNSRISRKTQKQMFMLVILDRVEYEKGLFKSINDTTKFRVLTSDPTLTREGKLTAISQGT